MLVVSDVSVAFKSLLLALFLSTFPLISSCGTTGRSAGLTPRLAHCVASPVSTIVCSTALGTLVFCSARALAIVLFRLCFLEVVAQSCVLLFGAEAWVGLSPLVRRVWFYRILVFEILAVLGVMALSSGRKVSEKGFDAHPLHFSVYPELAHLRSLLL